MDRRHNRGRGGGLRFREAPAPSCFMGCERYDDCYRRPRCGDEATWFGQANDREDQSPDQTNASAGDGRATDPSGTTMERQSVEQDRDAA